jgi:hypothetical protein
MAQPDQYLLRVAIGLGTFMTNETPPIPADWKRYQAPDQPSGVTIMAIPPIGTAWYTRDELLHASDVETLCPGTP